MSDVTARSTRHEGKNKDGREGNHGQVYYGRRAGRCETSVGTLATGAAAEERGGRRACVTVPGNYDLKESHKAEKERLVRRIADLEESGADRLKPMAEWACTVNRSEGGNFLLATVEEGRESRSSSGEEDGDTDVTGTASTATTSAAV